METLIGLSVIGIAVLFVWAITALIEQHLADAQQPETTEFDQYPLPDDFDEEAASEARQLLGIKDN